MRKRREIGVPQASLFVMPAVGPRVTQRHVTKDALDNPCRPLAGQTRWNEFIKPDPGMKYTLSRFESMILACCLSISCIAYAQEKNPTKDSNAGQGGTSESKSSQRIFGVVPAFDVSNSENVPPMTSREKFHLALRQSVDPFSIFGSAFKAGVYQAAGFNPEFGQGFSGFAKRFGASYADATSSTLLGTFVFPAVLHQDPRYFRKGAGSFKNRLGYSLKQVLITRTDAGSQSFNWSRVLGNLGSAGLSNAYYPAEDRGAGLTFGNFGWSMAGGTLSNALKEFWPDIHKKLSKKRAGTGRTSDLK
jgi:hypothetical protein